MDARATRMGSETLGYTAPRYVNLTPSQPAALWGSLPQGVKTIVKAVVVAAVVYAAVTFLLPASVSYTIGSAVAGIGSAVMGGINATLAFFGISTAAAGLGAAAASTSTLGAGAAAAAAGLGTATMLPAAKTASISTVALATPAPSILPDLSGSVAAIDPSTVLAKKSAIASNAATAMDLPTEALADAHHNHAHTDTGKIASKLGEEALEIRDHASKRHAPNTRDHISRIENTVAQWTDRVGGTKKPEHLQASNHTEALQKRDNSFATELNDERSRLEQALGHSV